jgi:hypothetical protein
MIEAFIGAFFGAAIGVICGVRMVIKSLKDATKITETKIIDGCKVTFIYEN